MAWNPTNTDDVSLTVSVVERGEDGSRTGTTTLVDTANVVVDDFTIGTEEDMEGLSGVGNATPQGVSRGDIEHTYDFTIQGEDAEVFNGLVSGSDGRSNELQLIATGESFKIKLTGAFAGTRELSGSSGDPTEYAVEGMATDRTNGTVSEGEGLLDALGL